RESLYDLLHGLVERPHRELRRDGRDLDRDVVDVIPLQKGARAAETAIRFFVAEHCLAEQVEIEPDVLSTQPTERIVEPGWRGIDHEVADHSAEHAAGDRHD